MQVGAFHSNHNVEIDLQVVRDAFFYGESLGRGAGEKACYLGPGEVEAGKDKGNGPARGVSATGQVGLFSFCWKDQYMNMWLSGGIRGAVLRNAGVRNCSV